MNPLAFEVNFNALPGPTHFYGGLSEGNLASMENRGLTSNPKLAALQCLEKMKLIHSLGVKQAILPPRERPHIPTLKALGFSETVESILENAQLKAPWLLELVSSSAGMWAANAGTVSPSLDSIDSHLHITPANLTTMFHRSIEANETTRLFKVIFPNNVFFSVHDPLPSSPLFADEGAANHCRFCKNYNGPGVQLFVFGRSLVAPGLNLSQSRFPIRQTLEASQAVARLHALYENHVLFAMQKSDAINAGVFHNDVISLGNQQLFFLHELAFERQAEVLKNLKKKVAEICDVELNVIEVSEAEVPIEMAVRTYLFNSELITLPDGSMTLIAPIECQRNDRVRQYLDKLMLKAENPIGSIHYVDLTQSMLNGGGPACMRMRMVLNENELAETNAALFFSDELYKKLVDWVNRHYPSSFKKEDLYNPAIYEKNCQALNEVSKILKLEKIYSFQ